MDRGPSHRQRPPARRLAPCPAARAGAGRAAAVIRRAQCRRWLQGWQHGVPGRLGILGMAGRAARRYVHDAGLPAPVGTRGPLVRRSVPRCLRRLALDALRSVQRRTHREIVHGRFGAATQRHRARYATRTLHRVRERTGRKSRRTAHCAGAAVAARQIVTRDRDEARHAARHYAGTTAGAAAAGARPAGCGRGARVSAARDAPCDTHGASRPHLRQPALHGCRWHTAAAGVVERATRRDAASGPDGVEHNHQPRHAGHRWRRGAGRRSVTRRHARGGGAVPRWIVQPGARLNDDGCRVDTGRRLAGQGVQPSALVAGRLAARHHRAGSRRVVAPRADRSAQRCTDDRIARR